MKTERATWSLVGATFAWGSLSYTGILQYPGIQYCTVQYNLTSSPSLVLRDVRYRFGILAISISPEQSPSLLALEYIEPSCVDLCLRPVLWLCCVAQLGTADAAGPLACRQLSPLPLCARQDLAAYPHVK
jgi:hypothetical protein